MRPVLRQWIETISRLPERMLWFMAVCVALFAHGATAAWLLHTPAVAMPASEAPAAIMIEFADESQAVKTVRNDITAAKTNSQASQEVKKAIEPPRRQVKQPVQPQPKITPEDIPVKSEVVLSSAADQSNQRSDHKTDKDKQSDEEAKRVSPASQQSIEAQAQTQQSDKNAARQATAGSYSSAVSDKWQARLMGHLERKKKYPSDAKSRGETGIVFVQFSIDDEGQVLSASIVGSSGFAALDNEVLSLVKRASPVPKPPADVPRTITAPIAFRVK
jgi:protein TonB